MSAPPRPAPLREPPAWLAPLAEALAEALPRLHGLAADPLIVELIGALTAALEWGVLDLPLVGDPPAGISAESWPHGHRRALEASPLAREPDGVLVLVDDRLSWRRWHRQRQTVLEELIRRAAPRLGWHGETAAPLTEPIPSDRAEALCSDPQQDRAVAAVLEHGLVLLEGGPGTGKTSTVARMVATQLQRDPHSRIHLAAPTGKAAARLRSRNGPSVPCTTLHRLLESRGESFARNRRHPLALDLVVVDEVSMVDMALMEALLEALPPSCALVLVGDPAQLPPLAPGPLLLELQRPALRQALGAAVITLRTPYRNAGAIAAIAAELRERQGEAGDPIAAIRPRLRALHPTANLGWLETSPLALPSELLRRLDEHRQVLADLTAACTPGEDSDASRALLLERDRLLVLSPVRQGRWGLEAIHRALLGDGIRGPLQGWPSGTPVLCCRNLSELGLANGDVGLLVGSGTDPSQRRLLFGDGGSEQLWIHPAQLAGAAEPALALTVHKAQGSEAEEVIVLLPDGERTDGRLLYTALTRARSRALLITPHGVR